MDEVSVYRQNNKSHVLLIGDLNGDSPVGTEVLVRLARHLITGETCLKCGLLLLVKMI